MPRQLRRDDGGSVVNHRFASPLSRTIRRDTTVLDRNDRLTSRATDGICGYRPVQCSVAGVCFNFAPVVGLRRRRSELRIPHANADDNVAPLDDDDVVRQRLNASESIPTASSNGTADVAVPIG